MTPLETQIAPGPNMIDAEAAPTPEPAENVPEIKTVVPEEESPRDKEARQKKQMSSDLRTVFKLVDSGGLENEELMQHLGPWAEKFVGKAENLAGIIDYFESAGKIIDKKLSPEQRAKVGSALAEIIADGHFDVETLRALVGKVEYGGKSPDGFNRVANYNPERLVITVYDELFEDIDSLPQNITHIVKGHEFAHGLNRWGEIVDNEMLAKTKEIIGDSEGLKLRETYHSTNAIDQYLTVKNRDGATAEEIEQKSRWLTEELLAEKTAAFLESNGEFGSFIEAQLEVMPWENVKKLFESGENELQDRWLAENKFFFDKISDQMKDKAAVKERILASTEEARAELAGHYDDDDFDWFDFAAGGFGEPGIPDNSKTPNGQPGGRGNEWIASLAQLAEAFGGEAEKSIPGTQELQRAA